MKGAFDRENFALEVFLKNYICIELIYKKGNFK